MYPLIWKQGHCVGGAWKKCISGTEWKADRKKQLETFVLVPPSSSHDNRTRTWNIVYSLCSVGKLTWYRQKERLRQLPTRNHFPPGSKRNTLNYASSCLLIRKIPSPFTIGAFFLLSSFRWLPLKTSVSEKYPSKNLPCNLTVNTAIYKEGLGVGTPLMWSKSVVLKPWYPLEPLQGLNLLV